MLIRSSRAGAGEHLVAQPAFPQQHRAGLRARRGRSARSSGGASAATGGRGHHQRQARILQPERAGAGRHDDVEGARDDAVRVDMARMGAARLQHIDPQAVELQPPPAEIERAIAREGGDVRREPADEIGEARIALRQVGERGVAGVAAIAMLARPGAAGAILGARGRGTPPRVRRGRRGRRSGPRRGG